MEAGESRSEDGQQLVPGVPLEDEVDEGVERRGALRKEAGQQRDGGGHGPRLLPVLHAPQADGHVGGPSNQESQTDHDGHLKSKS